MEFNLILKQSIDPIYGSLTGTTTPGQNGPKSNGNKWMILHFNRSRAS